MPDKVRRIDVGADHRSYRVSEFHKRFGVVHAEARVHFERDLLHAVLRRELDRFLPVRNKHFFPLVLEFVEVFVRPRASNPTGVLRVGVGTGATRERDHSRHADLTREYASSLEVLFKARRHRFVGVNAVAVYRQRRYFHIVFFERRDQFVALCLVLYEDFCVRVLGAGIAAHAQLELTDADRFEIAETFVEAHAAENAAYYAEFHLIPSVFVDLYDPFRGD